MGGRLNTSHSLRRHWKSDDPALKELANNVNKINNMLANIEIINGTCYRTANGGLRITCDAAEAGEGSLTDFYIYLASGSTISLTLDEILVGFDETLDPEDQNWYAEFSVSNGRITGFNSGVVGNGTLWDGDVYQDPEVAQTYYRMPIYISGKRVGSGGSFRENVFISGGQGIQTELLKIG